MAKEVNLYVTPRSTDTEKIKEYLDRENINYQVVDVDKDFKAHKRMLEATRGACGAPVTEIGNQIVCGFDSERLKETIDYELR